MWIIFPSFRVKCHFSVSESSKSSSEPPFLKSLGKWLSQGLQYNNAKAAVNSFCQWLLVMLCCSKEQGVKKRTKNFNHKIHNY